MNVLIDKSYITDYQYTSRYSGFPIYYNTLDNKHIYGITSHLKQDASYAIHTVQDYDTLDSIALKYYGRPDLYWVIADFNRIKDRFIKLYDNYTTLNIPNISEIGFEI